MVFVSIVAVTNIACAQQALHLADTILADAKLVAIEPSSDFVFTLRQTKYGEPQQRRVTTAEIVRWGAWSLSDREQAVWLRGDDWLAGDLRLSSDAVQVSSEWLERVDVDINSVRGLVLTPPVSASTRAALLQKMRQAEGDRDLVWLNDGRLVSGVVRIAEDKQLSQHIEVISGGQAVELAMDAIQAIVFSPALFPKRSISKNTTTLGLRDGTLLRAVSWKVTSTEVAFQLASGLSVSALDLPSRFAASIGFIAAEPSGVQQLSELEPASYRYVGETELSWPLGQDMTVWAQPLVFREGIIPHGLAMHGPSQVAYRWDGSQAKFLAELAIPDPPPKSQIVRGDMPPEFVCKVLVAEGGVLVERTSIRFDGQRFVAAAVPTGAANGSASRDNTAPAEHVRVDLTGVKLLVLAIESDIESSYGGQAAWLDARISR